MSSHDNDNLEAFLEEPIHQNSSQQNLEVYDEEENIYKTSIIADVSWFRFFRTTFLVEYGVLLHDSQAHKNRSYKLLKFKVVLITQALFQYIGTMLIIFFLFFLITYGNFLKKRPLDSPLAFGTMSIMHWKCQHMLIFSKNCDNKTQKRKYISQGDLFMYE